MRRYLFVPLVMFVVMASASAQSRSCGMSEAFKQPDVDSPGGWVPVWGDAQGNLMFIERLHVNTDGTKRSYSVDDFWGERYALNNLCNAMSDACAGLNQAQLRERRITTQEAARNGWPSEQLRRTRLSPQIIPMPRGKPCPLVDGYLVSATKLVSGSVEDECSLSRYVDSLVVPAIVIPKDGRGVSYFSRHGAAVGDLVTAVSIDGGFAVQGVVGDVGPSNKLGEASIAMNGRLLGRSEMPVNYREVRGRAPFKGRGWSVPSTFVLIYAKSRDDDAPFMSVDRIDVAGARRFAQWGGVDRARACIDEYRTALVETR